MIFAKRCNELLHACRSVSANNGDCAVDFISLADFSVRRRPEPPEHAAVPAPSGLNAIHIVPILTAREPYDFFFFVWITCLPSQAFPFLCLRRVNLADHRGWSTTRGETPRVGMLLHEPSRRKKKKKERRDSCIASGGEGRGERFIAAGWSRNETLWKFNWKSYGKTEPTKGCDGTNFYMQIIRWIYGRHMQPLLFFFLFSRGKSSATVICLASYSVNRFERFCNRKHVVAAPVVLLIYMNLDFIF